MSEEGKIKEIENFSFKNLRFFEGKIEGYGDRFCIFRKNQLKEFYLALQDHFKDGKEAILQKVGYDWGLKLFEALSKEILDEKTCFKYILTELHKLGWGKFWNINQNDDELRLEYQYPFEDFESDEISNYYVIGIIKGMVKSLLKEEIKVIKEERVQRGSLLIYKLRFLKKSIYDKTWEKIPLLQEVLDEFDKKAKTNYSMIVSSTGEILVQNNTESIDKEKFSVIVTTILGGIFKLSEMNVGNFVQHALMYDNGVIMAAASKNGKSFIVGSLNKQASVNLIGIALKQSCEKLDKIIN